MADRLSQQQSVLLRFPLAARLPDRWRVALSRVARDCLSDMYVSLNKKNKGERCQNRALRKLKQRPLKVALEKRLGQKGIQTHFRISEGQ